jgi:hypothetical protein
LFATTPGRTLPAELGLGPLAQKVTVLVLVATAVLLAAPQFRVAGVIIASIMMSAVAITMLMRRKYDYAIPALLVIATLPLALPGLQ